MSPKAAKILRRTVVGSTIGAVVIGVVLAAERFNHPGLILAVAALVALGGAYEISRLPRIGGWEVGVGLLLALAYAAVAVFACADEKWVGTRRTPTMNDWALPALLAPAAFGLFECIALRVLKSPRSWMRPLGLFVAILLWGPLFASFDGRHAADLDGLSLAGWAWVLVGMSFLGLADKRPDAWALSTSAALAAWLIPILWIEFVFVDWGARGLLALLLLSKIGDTAGYYAGNAFGRHHPFKGISPGKTTEGCVASLIAATATGAIVVALDWLPAGRFGPWGGLLAGATVNLAAQAGDLFESWIKRRAGVKDSGTWFGPSGGVLDLVDSLLFTIPVALLSWPWLFGSPD